VIHEVIVWRAELGQQDARHQRLSAILECGEAPRAEGSRPNNSGGPTSANGEAQGSCGDKENVENSPVALIQAEEELREGSRRQTTNQSWDALREMIEVHVAV
jgi:hypothetical protein